MYNRVYEFLLKENTIYDLQFGFQKGTSTTHALAGTAERNKSGGGWHKEEYMHLKGKMKAIKTK